MKINDILLEEIIRSYLFEQSNIEPTADEQAEYNNLKAKSDRNRDEQKRFAHLLKKYPQLNIKDIKPITVSANSTSDTSTYKSEKHVVFNNTKTLNDAIAALHAWNPSSSTKENLRAFSVRIKYKGGMISDSDTLRVLAGLIQGSGVSTTQAWVYFCSEDLKTRDQKQLFNIWGFGPDWTDAHNIKQVTDKIYQRGSVGAGATLVKWSDVRNVINSKPEIRKLFNEQELTAFSKLSDLSSTQTIVARAEHKYDTEVMDGENEVNNVVDVTTSNNVSSNPQVVSTTNQSPNPTVTKDADKTIQSTSTIVPKEKSSQKSMNVSNFKKYNVYNINGKPGQIISVYVLSKKQYVPYKLGTTERVQFQYYAKDKSYSIVKLLDTEEGQPKPTVRIKTSQIK